MTTAAKAFVLRLKASTLGMSLALVIVTAATRRTRAPVEVAVAWSCSLTCETCVVIAAAFIKALTSALFLFLFCKSRMLNAALLKGWNKWYAQVEEHYELMADQNVPVNAADMAEYRSVTAEFSNMKNNIDACEGRKAEDIDIFTKMLEQNMKVLEEDRKEAKTWIKEEKALKKISK